MLFRKIKDFCNVTSSRQLIDDYSAAFEILMDFFSHGKRMVWTGIRILTMGKVWHQGPRVKSASTRMLNGGHDGR